MAQQVTSNDVGSVVTGFLICVTTFMVGKIAVDNILQSRKEHFERKGQPKAAVKAKETTLDGLVKVAGMGFGLWRMSQDLPVVLAEAQKLLK